MEWKCLYCPAVGRSDEIKEPSMEAVRLIASRGWSVVQLKPHPNVIQVRYICPMCQINEVSNN